MDQMTARERMLIAMSNGKPDRVPVAPDISNMIPCRLTGKPFWEVYYFANPPLWKAYLDALDYFKFDGWFTDGSMQYQWPGERMSVVENIHKNDERWQVRTRHRLDSIEYQVETTYPRSDSPTRTLRPFKDIENDWLALEKLFQPPVGYNAFLFHRQREELGERGAFGVSIGYPGFHAWFDLFTGGLDSLSEWYYFKHDSIEALRKLHHQQAIVQMEMILAERPDFVLLSASGTLTLASPKIARDLCLPTIKELTKMAKQAGIPTMLHSCGKERLLVQWCAEETDLNCINPLEIPPMGDCDLAKIKQTYGERIALMGNLHTTDIMLLGSPADVEKAAKEAIEAAGAGGGFILSTGDQCGRDTPNENLFALIKASQTYGRYI